MSEDFKEVQDMLEQAKELVKTLENKYDELKNNGCKCVRWRAKHGETFWFTDEKGRVSCLVVGEYAINSHNYYLENFNYKTGNYFKTKEEAEKHKQYLIITQKLKDIALRLNNGVEINLKNWMDICRQKYKIVLKPYNNILLQAISTSIVDLGQIYCLSDKFLETAIKEIGEQELIEYIKEN